MRRKDANDALCKIVADELDVDIIDVRSAVSSFFGAIYGEAKRLPFDSISRIYLKEKFDDFANVQNIPSIGRIGPSYSRYLKWKSNESASITQVIYTRKGKRFSDGDIEIMADAILTGKPIPELKKKKVNELYKRVWLVGKNGKRLARQVIPKEEEYVQD